MAKKPTSKLSVETLTHDDATRKNIPTAEYQSMMQEKDQSPVRVAYERRNRDPQLVWRGKDEQDWEVRSDGAEDIACWLIDTDYNEENSFVRHAYFLGANDSYKARKTTLKAEINQEAWESLNSDISRPFDKPKSGRIAVKVINHLGDEVMKVFRV